MELRRRVVLTGVGGGILLTIAISWWVAPADFRQEVPRPAASRTISPRRGDLSKHGGSPTVRRPYIARDDDPSTTNNEANDQPVGHFGTVTLIACSVQAGHCYTLDGELTGGNLERLYFPKGGWIDFTDCALDSDLKGECDDEQGRSWNLRGTRPERP